MIEHHIREHAQKEYPRECCGVVIVKKGKAEYVPCRNIATTANEHFILSPEDYANAEDMGDIIAIVHSHPDTLPWPSEADKVSCEVSGLEWRIVNVTKDGAGMIYSFKPNGFVLPLVGRQFVHGVVDCFTLIRDFYAREMKVELPNFDREDNWWNKGQNLYIDNFEAAGFYQVRKPEKVGDVILMTIRSPKPNHGAVYIGDGKILQHMYNRLSTRDVYGGYWQENTHIVLRHKDTK